MLTSCRCLPTASICLLGILVCTPIRAQQMPDKSQENSQLADNHTKLVDQLSGILNEKGMDPVDYVVSKFKTHDIVLLGETHQIKENCQFVASLIEPLNRIGVKRLCSEFTPSRFNEQLRAIVTAEKYDGQAVKDLFRKGPWPTWGFQEYMDIVKSAWTVNQKRDKDKLPFLIVGIDSDWSQVQQFKMDRSQRFEMLMNREKHMTRMILQTSVEDDQKALVHIGYAHTVKHGLRVANELSKEHAERMYQIMLHHPLGTPRDRSEITTIIERAVTQSNKQRVGFDVTSTPLAKLETPKIPYIKTFADLAQGYICLKPVGQLSKATWVPGFINETNFEDALFLANRFRWTKNGVPENAQQLDELFAKQQQNDKK